MVAFGKTQSIDAVTDSVRANLDRFTTPGQSLLAGLSGGLDSVVLLHALSNVAIAMDRRVAAIHVHHGLSNRADSWMVFCQTYCSSLGIDLHSKKVIVPSNTRDGIENAARSLRRAAFAEVATDWVCLAHHLQDQAETVLHNMLRGTGVLGASGMLECHTKFLRPFLGIQRTTLLAYANYHELNWIEDESNNDLRFTRNYIRAAVMPIIRARLPSADMQLGKAAVRFRETGVLLDDLARLDLQGHPSCFPVPITLFRKISDVRAINLLRFILRQANVQTMSDARTREFVRQLQTADADRHPQIDLGSFALSCSNRLLHLEVKNTQ